MILGTARPLPLLRSAQVSLGCAPRGRLDGPPFGNGEKAVRLYWDLVDQAYGKTPRRLR